MNKSDIVKLDDEKLISHFLKYRERWIQRRTRYNLFQQGWAKEEIDRRKLVIKTPYEE